MLENLRLLPAEQAEALTPQQLTAALEAALARGERRPALPCPPAEGGAAYRTLRTAADFLLDHPTLEGVDLLCRQEDLAAYQLQWNMWFAERRNH